MHKEGASLTSEQTLSRKRSIAQNTEKENIKHGAKTSVHWDRARFNWYLQKCIMSTLTMKRQEKEVIDHVS